MSLCGVERVGASRHNYSLRMGQPLISLVVQLDCAEIPRWWGHRGQCDVHGSRIHLHCCAVRCSWTSGGVSFASDGTTNDNLGNSAALSDDTALVGAWVGEVGGIHPGSAYFFQAYRTNARPVNLSGSRWEQTDPSRRHNCPNHHHHELWTRRRDNRPGTCGTSCRVNICFVHRHTWSI